MVSRHGRRPLSSSPYHADPKHSGSIRSRLPNASGGCGWRGRSCL